MDIYHLLSDEHFNYRNVDVVGGGEAVSRADYCKPRIYAKCYLNICVCVKEEENRRTSIGRQIYSFVASRFRVKILV